MTGIATKRWRLVCHACGKKYPECAAVSVRNADCCPKPNIHLHDMEQPCEQCDEP